MSENPPNTAPLNILQAGKHAIIYGFGVILTQSIGFILIPIYTHYLTTADYGVLELLSRTSEIINIIIGAGLAMTVIRFFTLEDELSMKNAVVSTGITFIAIFGALCIALLLLNTEYITGLVFGATDNTHLVSLSIIICYTEILFVIPMAFVQARVNSALFIAFSLFKFILGLALNIYFVAMLKMNVQGVLYATLINGVISAALVQFWTYKQIGGAFNKELLWKMLKFGLPLVPGSVFLFVLNNGDRFLLQRFATSDILGKYALGCKIAGIIAIMVLGPFNKVWSVYVFKIAKRNDYGMIYPKVFKYLMLGYMLLGLGLAIYSKEIIILISESSYLEAFKIVPLMIFAFMIWTASSYFDLSFYIMNKTIYKPFLMGFGAVAVMVARYLLIPEYAMYGAAWSTIIGFGFFTLATYIVANKIYPLKYDFIRLSYLIAIAVVLYFTSTMIDTGNLWLNSGIKFLIWLLYLPILYIAAFFTKAEIQLGREFLVAARKKLTFARTS